MNRKPPSWRKSNTNHKRVSVLGLHVVVLRVSPPLPNINRRGIHQLPETSQYTYLHLLLSRFYATAGDTDHWQDASRILKCLEYGEEHTSELVWLVDSIQVYIPQIEEDFTTRIAEFLQGLVIYLTKFPADERNGDLLRTATVMAAEWPMSRQSSDNGYLPRQRQYILSSQDIQFGEENRETFDLVEPARYYPRLRFVNVP